MKKSMIIIMAAIGLFVLGLDFGQSKIWGLRARARDRALARSVSAHSVN